ncbi:MAG: hypothetical protein ACR2N6_02255 [Miltoncostaeaceae bacterium]
MRAFGFRPAVEPGVLKREWHNLGIRASDTALRVAQPGLGELFYDAEDRVLLLDGEPFTPTPKSRRLVREVLALIEDYERWVEAREGRDERIARTARSKAGQGRRTPYNPLAEARRVNRLLIPRTRRSR